MSKVATCSAAPSGGAAAATVEPEPEKRVRTTFRVMTDGRTTVPHALKTAEDLAMVSAHNAGSAKCQEQGGVFASEAEQPHFGMVKCTPMKNNPAEATCEVRDRPWVCWKSEPNPAHAAWLARKNENVKRAADASALESEHKRCLERVAGESRSCRSRCEGTCR